MPALDLTQTIKFGGSKTSTVVCAVFSKYIPGYYKVALCLSFLILHSKTSLPEAYRPHSHPKRPQPDQDKMRSPAREKWMCQYTGRLCYNPRAASATGMLRLCPFHRVRANHNQQRYQWRKRVEEKLTKPAHTAVNEPTDSELQPLPFDLESAFLVGLHEPRIASDLLDMSVSELKPIPFDLSADANNVAMDPVIETDSMIYPKSLLMASSMTSSSSQKTSYIIFVWCIEHPVKSISIMHPSPETMDALCTPRAPSRRHPRRPCRRGS
jgi:hypothetical protein